jgi:hypothetical protein
MGTEEKQMILPAEEVLFFDVNPKSVLLKQGPIKLLHGTTSATSMSAAARRHDGDLANERHLMLFSRGFVVANVAVTHTLRLFLELNDRDIITEKNFLKYLHAKLFLCEDHGDHTGKGECCCSKKTHFGRVRHLCFGDHFICAVFLLASLP